MGFVEKLKKAYAPSLILMFGSRARGDELRGSDYDIMVVSSAFEGKGWIRRHEEAYAYWDNELDLLCYSPEEFRVKRGQIGIVSKALKEGTVIYQN